MTYNCQVQSKLYEARYSEIVDFNPLYTALFDILCLAFFAYFKWFKSTWSVQRSNDKLRNSIFAMLCTISCAICILSAFNITSLFLADLLRPFVVISFFRTVRFNIKEFYYDLKASFTILATVFVWIFYYTMFGFYLFRYTFEGAQNFVDLKTSYSSMFTALTTANFPDVALPAM